MQVVQAEVEGRRLAFLAHLLVEFGPDLLDDSSMRAGWIRPSAMRRSMACFAISRRYGSNPDR